MWSDFDNILFTLDKFVFIANFLLLAMALLFERKVSSFVIALIVLAVANGVMTALFPLIYQYALQSGMLSKFLWYGSFATIDAIAVILLYKLHALLKQSVCSFSSMVGMLFVMMASLQSLRFVDRFIAGTDILHAVYQYAIPAINISTVLYAIVFGIHDIYKRRSRLNAEPQLCH